MNEANNGFWKGEISARVDVLEERVDRVEAGMKEAIEKLDARLRNVESTVRVWVAMVGVLMVVVNVLLRVYF